MSVTRRQFLFASGACAASAWMARRALAETGQIWGGIRWDAWWSTSRDAIEAQHDVSPSKWQFRAPAWAKRTNDPNSPEFAPTQDDMDEEIAVAHAAGLKYWAYDYYPTIIDHDFMNALHFHRKSSVRSNMNYCIVLQIGHWGDEGDYKSINASIVDMTKDKYYHKYYQKVRGRPVVFMFWNERVFVSIYKSQTTRIAMRVADLRSQITAAGLAEPYVALMKYRGAQTLADIGGTR